MIINHNITALNTHRQLSSANSAQTSSMEKLSSGLRINSAKDDAAGLSISEKMRGQIRGLEQASKNSQDAISMIQTAEGALNETHDILQRMREVSTQSANGTLTDADRGALQDEMNQLTSEINRIGSTTEFNSKKLLNGDLSSTSMTAKGTPTTTTVTKAADQIIKVGADPVSWTDPNNKTEFDVKFTGKADNEFDWSNVNGTVAGQSLVIEKSGNDFTVNITATDSSAVPKTLTVDADAVSFDADSQKFTYNNHGVSFSFTKDQADAWKDGDKVTVDLDQAATTASSNLTTDVISTDSGIQGITTQTGGADSVMSTITVDGDSSQLLEGVAKVDVAWTAGQAVVTLQDKGGAALTTSTFSLAAGDKLGYDANGIKFDFTPGATSTGSFKGTFNLEMKSTSTTTNVGEIIEDKSASFQIGANAGQELSLSFSDMRASALGLTGSGNGFSAAENVTNGTGNVMSEKALDMKTKEGASGAITLIDKAIATVSSERSKLGATQNRLEHTINNLNTSAENLTSAESRIRDVDYAEAA